MRRRSHGAEATAAAGGGATVAIVGASFSGLSLARALQRDDAGGPPFDVWLFEEEEGRARQLERENGMVNLCGREASLMERLGLGALCATLTRHAARRHYVQRREILRIMVDSLRPGTVRHGLRLRSVAAAADGRFVLDLEAADDGDGGGDARRATVESERFDHVVLAYGLSGLTSTAVPPDVAERVALVGDARTQFGLEPWFGYQRINYGASSAMADGLCLADRLLARRGGRGGGGGESAGEPDAAAEVASGVYSAARWQRTRRMRRTFMPPAFALLLLALITWLLFP